MLAALILAPAAAALLAWLDHSPRRRAALLIVTAALHLAGTLSLWARPAPPALLGWLRADPLGLLVLTVVSLLFSVIGLYAVGYLVTERPRGGRVFVACLLGFLATASLVALGHHFALIWIGMETSTLVLAPLVFHRHDRRSLEAVWKYLILSSVGIGLALFGIFFLAAAQVEGRPLIIEDMVGRAATMQPGLLRAAFVFLLVGFGTKMGLAPLHSWKPDAYGEAPSLVAGLMAGGLTSCAFLGVARVTGLMAAAGQFAFVRPPLLALGVLSLIVAAAFMIGQRDLKRLLAYSSVEHMGLLALGLGIGGSGGYGAVLHLVNNGLIKGMMFLTVGNVVMAYQTSLAPEVRGVLRRAPLTGLLLLAGLFAVTGSPPFGLFVSEFTILGAAVRAGSAWLAVLIVVLLSVIFLGMARTILEVVYGQSGGTRSAQRESLLLVGGPAALLLIVLVLGVYLPPPLKSVLSQAAALVGGQAP
jgi:hydrogenase-4 component F